MTQQIWDIIRKPENNKKANTMLKELHYSKSYLNIKSWKHIGVDERRAILTWYNNNKGTGQGNFEEQDRTGVAPDHSRAAKKGTATKDKNKRIKQLQGMTPVPTGKPKPKAKPEKKAVVKEPTLQKKVTGSLYKGETWDKFLNEIPATLLPKYVAPILFVPLTNTLIDNMEKRFGEDNVDELETAIIANKKDGYEIYLSISEDRKNYKTRIPDELIPEMMKRIKQNVINYKRDYPHAYQQMLKDLIKEYGGEPSHHVIKSKLRKIPLEELKKLNNKDKEATSSKTDKDLEMARLFLSALSKMTLQELVDAASRVSHWAKKVPSIEKELEDEYKMYRELRKAEVAIREADRKEKASKPQSEQAKDLYKQMRKTNSIRELDDWRNRVLFEAHLTDVQEDILMRELAGNWRIYLESRGVPASEKLDKLGSDLPDDEYYFGTEVTIHPTTTIFDDSPIIGIIHTARNQGELFEVAWDSPNGSIISRVPIERLYVRKLVTKPEPRYQAPAKKIEDYKGVKYIVDKDNYVWVQESPYPKLDKHYTYLSEFKRHVDTLEKRKQDEGKPKEENIITETFPTLREAEQRRFNLQYKGFLIKDEVVADTSVFGKPKYSISYIPENKDAYAGFKELK